MNKAELLVCAIIRGDVASWPASDESNVAQLLSAAFAHNIHLILLDAIKGLPSWDGWPLRLRNALEDAALAACAFDLLHEQELRRVLIRLDGCGVRPILLKGVPLAYSLYKSPALRPRSDADMMIRESDAKPLGRILTELGYAGPDIETTKLASYECQYSLFGAAGAQHILDVHWKLSNAQLFAETLTFDEMSAEAMNIPSLAPCAMGLSYRHALLLACLHRFGHAHAPFYARGEALYAGDHLRWIYDIHLLCSALSPRQWSEFTELAAVKHVATFCLDGLNATIEAFKTQIPEEAVKALQTAARNEKASVEKLRNSAPAWLWANLNALPHLRQRLAFIRQVVLPSSDYMMKRYRTNNRLVLPFLYGFRSAGGIVKRLKRSGSRT